LIVGLEESNLVVQLAISKGEKRWRWRVWWWWLLWFGPDGYAEDKVSMNKR
jgi:hypothetical protein